MEKQISTALSLLFTVLLFFSCEVKEVTPDENKVKYPQTKYDEARYDDQNYLLN